MARRRARDEDASGEGARGRRSRGRDVSRWWIVVRAVETGGDGDDGMRTSDGDAETPAPATDGGVSNGDRRGVGDGVGERWVGRVRASVDGDALCARGGWVHGGERGGERGVR